MRLGALVPAGIFLVIAGFFLVAIFHGDPSRLPSALIGREVPVFDLPSVEGLDRPGLSSRDFGQDEAAIVNVWASWCVPCRDEHPVLIELKRMAGVPLYGINYKDAPEAAGRFLGELGNPFERVGADRSGRVGIDWGVYGVPETYVVDGKGRIAYKHVGPLTLQAVKDEILPALERAQAGTRARN
jgi:cytochrome c biogenesis protein CcmG/thiol:disulfide interchange protein DsbE